MFHSKRRWCVAPVENAEVLAEKLTEHTWTLCTAFQLGGPACPCPSDRRAAGSYLFLNDATSEDGAQEYAVLKVAKAAYIQIESITFSWCTRERALELIRQVLAGKFDAEGFYGPVRPWLEAPENHCCQLCA